MVLINSHSYFELLFTALDVARQLGIASNYQFHGSVITKGVRHLVEGADSSLTVSKAYQEVFEGLGIKTCKNDVSVTDIYYFLKKLESDDEEKNSSFARIWDSRAQDYFTSCRITKVKGQEHTILAAAELFKIDPRLKMKLLL